MPEAKDVMRSRGLKIRKYTEGKKKGYLVDGYLDQKDQNGNPKRIRKKFWGVDAEDAAIGYRSHMEGEDKKEHSRESYRSTRLDEETEYAVLSLIKDLRKELGDEKTPDDELLKRAVSFFIESPVKGLQKTTVSEARDLFVRNPKFQGRSETHKNGFKYCLKHFCSDFGPRDICTISEGEVEDWIYDRRESSQHTKLNEYRFLHAFFAWCLKKQLIGLNAVSAIDKPEVEIPEPVSLSNRQVADLLFFANKVKGGSMTPYFAVGIFAGVRPRELIRAEWEDFDWDESILRVRQRKGGKFTRQVELPETCIKWLDHVNAQERSGDFAPKNNKKLFNLIRACAGFRQAKSSISSMDWYGLDAEVENCEDETRPEWVIDQMRHTAITHRLRVVKHEGEVGEWAGNTPQTIKKHYKSVKGITKKSTSEFYKLTPGKVLREDLA